MSPFTEGRGLKPWAWWKCERKIRSPFTEGRGLKPNYYRLKLRKKGSPFTEGRGLKPLLVQRLYLGKTVALHGGAWIETS